MEQEKNLYKWNVMSEEAFKERLLKVFEMVSGAIINTLGPYGSQIIIDQFGEHHITKDGWSVLKRLRFQDEEMVLNSILSLFIRIAGPVVATVGDGSSSSIALSNFLYRMMTDNNDLKNLRPKERQDALQEASRLLQEKIQSKASQIDREGDLDEIYRLAYISTNGDEEVSRMIQSIYQKTGNSTIYYKEAKGTETSYEVTDGYKLRVSLIDNIFINTDDGSCEIQKPYILAFDHKVSNENYPAIIHEARQVASAEGRKLVVIAPYYARNFLTQIAHEVRSDFQNYGHSDVIYCVASTGNNIMTNYYSDFVMLTGAKMYTEIDFDRRQEGIQFIREVQSKDIQTEEDRKGVEEKVKELETKQFLGEVSYISISDKDCTANGFYKRNESLYQIHLKDARARYQELRERNLSTNTISMEEYDLKQRVSKLSCSMGTIYVGGSTSIERHSKYDLVEDAVKACESAYNYGYNIGGNLSIVYAASELRAERDAMENPTRFDEAVTDMIDGIGGSAAMVYHAVLTNKFDPSEDKEKLAEIVDHMIRGEIYNLITDEYDTGVDIINSCRTDIEILRASVGIVSLLMSSSLYLSIDPSAGQ